MIKIKTKTPIGLRLVITLLLIFSLWVSVYAAIMNYQEKQIFWCSLNIMTAIICIIFIIKNSIQYMLEDNSDDID